jgi:hypothetical protein
MMGETGSQFESSSSFDQGKYMTKLLLQLVLTLIPALLIIVNNHLSNGPEYSNFTDCYMNCKRLR